MDAPRPLPLPLALALAALLPACHCAKVPEDALFACEIEDDCRAGERCVGGYCLPSFDGALPAGDAGADAGEPDAGDRPDAGEPDAGPRESDCWNDLDDDGDLAIDCADPDCLDAVCAGSGQCDAEGTCACAAGERLCNRVCQSGVGCCSSADCQPQGSVCEQGACRCGTGSPCTGDKVCVGESCTCPGSRPEDCGGEVCGQCCSHADCTDGISVCLEGGTCGACGTEGQACCPDGMPTCAESSLVCSGATKTCVRCGTPGGPCCASAPACGPGLGCLNDGTCAVCGGEGKPCCEGNVCRAPGDHDEPAPACEFGTCSRRGFTGNGCTFDQACYLDALCGTELPRSCQACGAVDEACCAGNSCRDGACCVQGRCLAQGSACLPLAGSCKQGSCEAGLRCGGRNEPACTDASGGLSVHVCTAPGTLAKSSVCSECGKGGEFCCAGAACLDAEGVCNAGTCATCSPGNPCCAGGVCTSGCCVDGTCVAPGGACPAKESDNGVCLASGRCSGCGAAGQPCCTGPDSQPSVCNPALTCSPSSKLCE